MAAVFQVDPGIWKEDFRVLSAEPFKLPASRCLRFSLLVTKFGLVISFWFSSWKAPSSVLQSCLSFPFRWCPCALRCQQRLLGPHDSQSHECLQGGHDERERCMFLLEKGEMPLLCPSPCRAQEEGAWPASWQPLSETTSIPDLD